MKSFKPTTSVTSYQVSLDGDASLCRRPSARAAAPEPNLHDVSEFL
jgi:hypothetical protein